MSLLSDGQVIGGYEVERLLGEGAFAEVYRVKHRFLGRQAMKVFKAVGMTLDETERMLEEATMLSQMRHPNIIQVFDANTTETSKGMCGFFTMEYIAGGSLEQFWRSHGARFVPVATVGAVMAQVCQGLAVAHREDPPIIHRDVKPQNILVGYDTGGLRAHVTDFGLAKRVNAMTLTASGRGTLVFKAPEVFRDFQSDSCTGDVWAIGSTLYMLLTDRLPYPELGDHDTRRSAFERPLTPPSRLNLEVDPMLDQIALRALEREPERRYRDAGALLEDLNLWRSRSLEETKGRKAQVPASSQQTSKEGLGAHTSADEDEAREMAAEAIRLSHQAGRLRDAADLMEEAFNKWPELRERHERQLKLWRNGVVM